MTDRELLRQLGNALLNTLTVTLVILALIAANEPAVRPQPVVEMQWRR